MGAARLNIMRWLLACLLLRPALSKTDVSPKAAGALWSMMAMKMMKLSRVLDVALEAPRAMPSAKAWMTRPTVVDKLFEPGVCGVGG
jgi:hypothetical protein